MGGWVGGWMGYLGRTGPYMSSFEPTESRPQEVGGKNLVVDLLEWVGGWLGG